MWTSARVLFGCATLIVLAGQRGCGDHYEPELLAIVNASDACGFGISMDVDRDVAAVGAWQTTVSGLINAGAVYLYRNVDGTWLPDARIENPDPAQHDNFGVAVALRGSRLLISAYLDDEHGPNHGAVYVYEHEGNAWVKKHKLFGQDSSSADYFGIRVALTANQALVCASYDDDKGADSGSIYVFENGTGGWSQVQKITASDGAAGDLFGISFSVESEVLMAGAFNDDDLGTDSGSVIWFELAGGLWVERGKLHASDGQTRSKFGSSVDLDRDGEYAVVGAPWDKSLTGAAYVFARAESGWIEVNKLKASDADYDTLFGGSVSMDERRILVGSRSTDDWCETHPDNYPCDDPDEEYSCDSGSAYVFDEVNWSFSESAKIVPLDAECGDEFGSGLLAVKNIALFSALGDFDVGCGSVYVYDLGSLRVASIVPNSGPFHGGNLVVIEGCRFTADTNVFFGGTQASSVTVVNESRIEAIAPEWSGIGNPLRWRMGYSKGLSIPVDVRLENSKEKTVVKAGYRYLPTLH